ncbi:unnamed protein product [Caenorhabditis brenneri]
MLEGKEFHEFLSFSYLITAGSSLVLNALLIYLIAIKSPKEFGSYKYLLIFTSVFEVWYAVLEAYLTPIHFSVGTTDIVLISVNDKSISRTWIRILNSAYWGGFGATQSIYAVHFVYRYLAVSRNSLLETFDSWKLILWFLVPFSMGAAWSFLGLALCGPNPELTELVRKSVMSSFGESIDNFEYLGGTMYDIKKDGSIDLHYKFLISAALMSNIVSVSFAIIIYCGVKCYSLIYKMMDTSITISPKSRAIQSQLFYALLFQIAIPTVLLDVPLTIFFGLNITNNGIEGYRCCRKKKVTDGASTFANSEVQLEMRSQIPN